MIKNDFRLLINNCAGQTKNNNRIVSLALPQHCPFYRGDSHQGHLQTPREARQKEDQEVNPGQLDWYVNIKWNWWKPRGPDNRVLGKLKGQIRAPGTGDGSNKDTEVTPPGGFRKLLVHSFREPAVLLTCNNLPALRLLTTSPPRAQSHCGKSNPASPQSHQSYARLPSRRWTDSSCAHGICVNKTTKTWPSGISKKNNIFKTPTESRTHHHCQPGILYPIKFFQKWIQIKDFSKRKKRQWLSTVYLYHNKH